MDYNKTVLKRWSRTILSICSTLLNVPLKLKGRSRTRLGFGFFFCVFTIIFPCRCPHNAACPPAPPQNRWPSCAFFRTLFSAGRCFLLFPWPFSRTGNLLVLLQPAAAPAGLWSLLLQPFLSPAFLPCCKIGHTEARQKRWIFQRKIRLIFLFLFY